MKNRKHLHFFIILLLPMFFFLNGSKYFGAKSYQVGAKPDKVKLEYYDYELDYINSYLLEEEEEPTPEEEFNELMEWIEE